MGMLFFPFLSQKELETMAFDHKYSSTGASIIDMLFLKAFSTWLATKLPLNHNLKAAFHWTAPNTLTFVGLLCMVIPSSVVMYTSHDLLSPSPALAYLATAMGIFAYQILDELDGKQARRTNSSSPLGELFDHGCDAVSTFVTVGACLCVCQTGYTVGAFGAFISSLMAFQGAHIQTYYKGKLFFGLVDVAEAQWSGILMNMACFLVDPNFFSSAPIPGTSLPRQIVPIVFVIGGSSVAMARNLFVTTVARADNVAHAKSSPLATWAQWTAMHALSWAWFLSTREGLLGSDRILLLSALGLLNAAQTLAIIVAHMAHTEIPAWNYLRMVPMLLAVANARVQLVPDSQVVLMVFCGSLVHFVHYGVSLSAQIAEFLGVSVFKVGPPTCVDTRH
uniref:CDP-alcohol phosphatidyltransferase n=1 Tax=Hemiselmis andersenii TaxID=464988 RepID=A0A6T8K3P4_HEMAN|mmetsp:Transcript_6333/g.15325  ORF Transcript_6333/g.15325 Transcript_6333/m.15325 type:complete len:392 (-) Transcript_6333:300-1475(-)